MSEDLILQTRGLTKEFKGFAAVQNVDLKVKRGNIHALIGPNGAGKTTVFNCLTGFYQPTSGSVRFQGEEVSGLPGFRIARKGMVRTFQINQLFDSMTPLQTLALVVSQRSGLGRRWWSSLGHNAQVAQRCEELLIKFHLAEVMNQRTRELAYGKRRLLEIAIALACEPRVLLLDEPVAGVPAGEREELLQTVADLPADVSVLLIEHDMGVVMDLSDRVVVMDYGKKIGDGPPDEVRNNQAVIDAYLGVAHD